MSSILPGVAPMMSHAVVRSIDFDIRIGQVAALAPHHERRHPSHVGLERECHQIEHQAGMISVVRGNPVRAGHRRIHVFTTIPGCGNSLLYVPHAGEVLVEFLSIRGTHRVLGDAGRHSVRSPEHFAA